MFVFFYVSFCDIVFVSGRKEICAFFVEGFWFFYIVQIVYLYGVT